MTLTSRFTCSVCNDTGGYYNASGKWQRCTSCCGHPRGSQRSSRPINFTNCPTCGNGVDVTPSGTIASHTAWHGDGPCSASGTSING